MSYLVNNKILHAQDNNKEHLINNLFELIKKKPTICEITNEYSKNTLH